MATSYENQSYSEAKDTQSDKIRGLQNAVYVWNTTARAPQGIIKVPGGTGPASKTAKECN